MVNKISVQNDEVDVSGLISASGCIISIDTRKWKRTKDAVDYLSAKTGEHFYPQLLAFLEQKDAIECVEIKELGNLKLYNVESYDINK